MDSPAGQKQISSLIVALCVLMLIGIGSQIIHGSNIDRITFLSALGEHITTSSQYIILT